MFKNIENWRDKKLRAVWLLLEGLNLILTVIAPVVTICIKYHLFEKAVQDRKLNGFLLILIIVVAYLGLRTIKKLVTKLPDSTIKEQWIKYSIKTAFATTIPAFACFVLWCFKDDFDKAYNTFIICLAFYTVGLVVENLFLSFIDKERWYRKQADEKIEVEKRMHRIK